MQPCSGDLFPRFLISWWFHWSRLDKRGFLVIWRTGMKQYMFRSSPLLIFLWFTLRDSCYAYKFSSYSRSLDFWKSEPGMECNKVQCSPQRKPYHNISSPEMEMDQCTPNCSWFSLISRSIAFFLQHYRQHRITVPVSDNDRTICQCMFYPFPQLYNLSFWQTYYNQINLARFCLSGLNLGESALNMNFKKIFTYVKNSVTAYLFSVNNLKFNYLIHLFQVNILEYIYLVVHRNWNVN